MAGRIRGSIPNIITKALNLDNKSLRTKAEIYYHYPQYCRMSLTAIMTNYQIESLAIKEHIGRAGQGGTAYFAVVLRRKTPLIKTGLPG